MRPAQVMIGAIVAVALAGGGFAAGMTVAQSRTSTTAATSASPDTGRQGAQGRVGAAGGGAAAQFGGALTGRVISVNADSITVEVRQPGAAGAGATTASTIALVGQNTRLVRTTETDIKLGDIKANDQVTVIGQADQTTGTVAANAIIVGGNALNQLFGGAGQSGAPRPAASGTPRPSP